MVQGLEEKLRKAMEVCSFYAFFGHYGYDLIAKKQLKVNALGNMMSSKGIFDIHLQEHSETSRQLERQQQELTEVKKESHKRKKMLVAQQHIINNGNTNNYNKVKSQRPVTNTIKPLK